MAGNKFTSDSQSVPFTKLSGGLNSTAGPLSLDNSESSSLQNVEFSRFGSVLKRKGYTALNTSALGADIQVTSLHFLELSSGTNYLITTAGAAIYKMDSLDGTWDDITGAVTITAANLFKWDTFLDTAIGTNGTNVPIKWTGTGNAAVLGGLAGGGSAPTINYAKFIKVFNGYTFLGNVKSSNTVQASRLHWSAINTIETWVTTDFADIARNDGQDINGLEVLGDKLVIFKDRSIHVGVFTGDADIPFLFYKTNSNVGAVSGFSIQEINNGLVFLSFDGFYFFDGNTSTKLSDRINTTIQGLNLNKFQFATSVNYKTKKQYMVSFMASGSTENDTMIVWDYHNNAFSVWKGIAFSSGAIVFAQTADERWYFGDYDGFVYRGDSGLNDSPLNVATAVNAYWYSRWIDFGEVSSKKGIPHIYVYYQLTNGVMTCVFSYDFESGDQTTLTFNMQTDGDVYDDPDSIYGTATYGGGGGQVQRLDCDGRGRVVRFGFKNATLSRTFTLDGLGVLVSLDTSV